ncbi:peptidoglycan-binding protein [Desulfobulbus rhabdoformis]|uniref:peptidoglycan-binding protein n=1 Tax=Desulfobulbus rhabdoformis TaxID=34032 RepID=UPI001964B1B0|nr:peptidoglycan-binding protein [Desulfobulbus rhabdoformis]MBM9614521.1 peptidoglycan-binding protein [Desulfobulbus rhabdoformis]
MEKITCPLKKGDKGSAIVNLQDALLVMLDRKVITPISSRILLVWKTGLASERSSQTYGTATFSIVKKFQEDHSLKPDGVIGQQTMVAINRLLDKWGLLEQNTEPESSPYKVQGHVKQADGRRYVGGLVRVFDKDLRHEQLLGKGRTDRQGFYVIGYTKDQFSRAEKHQADLLVRVYSAGGSLLAESDIMFNAQTEAIVDLVINSVEPEGFEHARLLAEISPLLEGVPLEQLTPEDIAFLSGETGLDSVLIADLVAAAKLEG